MKQLGHITREADRNGRFDSWLTQQRLRSLGIPLTQSDVFCETGGAGAEDRAEAPASARRKRDEGAAQPEGPAGPPNQP